MGRKHDISQTTGQTDKALIASVHWGGPVSKWRASELSASTSGTPNSDDGNDWQNRPDPAKRFCTAADNPRGTVSQSCTLWEITS